MRSLTFYFLLICGLNLNFRHLLEAKNRASSADDSIQEDIRNKYDEIISKIYFNRTLCPNITHNETYEKFKSVFTNKELQELIDDSTMLQKFLVHKMCSNANTFPIQNVNKSQSNSTVVKPTEVKRIKRDEHKPSAIELNRNEVDLKHNLNESNPNKTETTQNITEISQNITEISHNNTEINHNETKLNHNETEINLNVTEFNHNETEINLNVTEFNHNETEINLNVTEFNHNETGEFGEIAEPYGLDSDIMWDPIIDRDGLIGCFRDGSHPLRDMPLRTHGFSVTPISCRASCFSHNFKFAGVQYGYLCFCGNTYGNYGDADLNECLTPCHGNFSLACGSFWRNLVYNTTSSIKHIEESIKTLSKRSLTNSSNTSQNINEVNATKAEKIIKKETIPKNVTHNNATSKKVSKPPPKIKIMLYNATFHKPKTIDNHSNDTQIKPSFEDITKPLTTPKPHQIQEDFNLTKEAIPKPKILSGNNSNDIIYLGQIVTKQQWSDEYNKTKSAQYQIFGGNLNKALNKTFKIYHNLKEVQVFKMRPKHIWSFNTIPRTAILFMLRFHQHFSNKNSDPIKYLEGIISKDAKIQNIPVYRVYFNMTLKSESKPVFDDNFPSLKKQKKSALPIEVINENRNILKEFFKNDVLDRRRRQTELETTLSSLPPNSTTH